MTPRSSDGDGPAALSHAAIPRPHDHPRREHRQQDHAEPQRRPRDPGLEQDVDQDRHVHREHDDVGVRQVRPGDGADRLVEPGPGQRDQPGRDRRAGPDPRARGDHQDRGGDHDVVPLHALVDHDAEHPRGRELVVRPAVGDDPDAVEEVGPGAGEPDRQEAQRRPAPRPSPPSRPWPGPPRGATSSSPAGHRPGRCGRPAPGRAGRPAGG